MQQIHKNIKTPLLVLIVALMVLGIVYAILQVALVTQLQLMPVKERMIETSTMPLTYKWSYAAPTPIRDHPIAVAGLVILRTDDSLIALKAEPGEPVWIVPAPSFLGPFPVLAIQDNIILVATDRETKFKAVDVRDGTVLWTQEPNGHINEIATDAQRVYIGLNRKSIPLKAYDLQNGEPIWNTDLLKPLSDSVRAMAVTDNELYAVVDSNLFVLDSRTGALKKTMPSFYQGNDIQLVNQVALTWFNKTLLARDAKTGNKLWQFNKRPNFFNVIGDRVYVSSDCCALHALDFRTGQLIWERPLPLLTASEVVTVGDTGYVILVDGSILAFDTVSGADRGKLQTTPHSVGINVPDRGLGTDGTSLYATFGDNKVFAFGP